MRCETLVASITELANVVSMDSGLALARAPE